MTLPHNKATKMTMPTQQRTKRPTGNRSLGNVYPKALARAALMIPFLSLLGCAGILSDMSADGELNEEYRLKNQYKECLKQSAQDGRDCGKIKDALLQEQQWNFMDGGV